MIGSFAFLEFLVRFGSVSGALIDPALGELRQLFVCGLLLVEVFLQKRRRVSVAHRLCPCDQGAIGCDLVMLRALTRGNQTGVERRIIEVFLHEGLAFFDDARDTFAVLPAHFLLETFEHLFQAFDLTFCLFEMRLERLAQIW